jgi:Ran GTPase-activating protein (RanGAP) involved in mRNA processing and transport
LAGAGAPGDGAGDDSSHDDTDDKDYAQARQLDIVTDICNIHIENVEMKKERIAALVAIFRNGRDYNSSKDFNFNNANICGEGIKYLSNLVYVSSMLQSFSISHNQIDNMESACCLSRSLKSSSSIDDLSLAYCDLGRSPEILSIMLKSDVRYINLKSNNIDSLGAVTIAEYLGSNPPIHCIKLLTNRLNDDDALLTSQALKRNSNLRHLDLLENNFSSSGVKALLPVPLMPQV